MITVDLKSFIKDYWKAISGKPKTPKLMSRFTNDQDLINHVMAFETPFPRYELKAEKYISEGDMISVIARARGTHKGNLLGIPATGKTIDLPFSVTYKVKDDKIVKSWLFFDQMELMKQLGLASQN